MNTSRDTFTVLKEEPIMAYTLKIQSPVFDNRDCIRGTRTRSLPEFGSFETVAFAFKKADLLHDQWHLELGDGDNIQVWENGQRVHRTFSTADSFDVDAFAF
ncbi:hypothetical protein VI03_24765 [Burkholderia vietnamiensis]|nr:hypothetical protein VI03_24765 [Burkholderia vietnamiensis]